MERLIIGGIGDESHRKVQLRSRVKVGKEAPYILDPFGVDVRKIGSLLDIGVPRYACEVNSREPEKIVRPRNRKSTISKLAVSGDHNRLTNVGAVGLKRYTVTGAIISGRVTLADCKYV
jgi:hypothetical protein